MNREMEKYLSAVDRHLKPLPTSERVDIVKEIKSSILEMESDNLPEQQILERLGDPREMAKAYLGDMITKEKGFGLNKLLLVCAFYSVVGFSGLFVIPTLGIIAPVFMFCGALCPILGAAKLADYLLRLNLPFMKNVAIFQFGSYIVEPVPAFFLSILTGAILYLVGKASWKLLIFYCKKVSSTKRDLDI